MLVVLPVVVRGWVSEVTLAREDNCRTRAPARVAKLTRRMLFALSPPFLSVSVSVADLHVRRVFGGDGFAPLAFAKSFNDGSWPGTEQN